MGRHHLLAAVVLSAVMAVGTIAAADPYEADPDLAARDEDYAAGKRAADAKNWLMLFDSLNGLRYAIQTTPTFRTFLDFLIATSSSSTTPSSIIVARSISIHATAAPTSTSARHI